MSAIKFTSLLFFICLLTNCTDKASYTIIEKDGVKIISNDKTEMGKVEPVKLKEICALNSNEFQSFSSTSPSGIDFDQAGNIFVLNSKECNITKYDKHGNLIATFAGKGQGPGEFTWAQSIIVIGDTLFVPDGSTLNVNKYSLSGKYLSQKQYYSYNDFPLVPQKSNSSDFIINNSFTFMINEDGLRELTYSSKLFDRKLNFIRDLKKTESKTSLTEWDANTSENIAALTSDNSIYISEVSTEKYEISMYDTAGIKKTTVRKKYLRIPIDEDEKSKMLNSMKAEGVIRINGTFQNAIKDLWVDQDNYLWVKSAIKGTNKNHQFFDVFKDGILLKNVSFPLNSDYIIKYKQNKFVAIDNKNGIIKIYNTVK